MICVAVTYVIKAGHEDEAIELFQLALRLEPQDLGLRLAIARLRKLKRAQNRSSEKDPIEVVRDELRRAAIDASHFVGLAWLYAEKGEEYRALECLEIARAKDAISPAAYKLAGRLHYHLQDYDAAADHLHRALRFNPFDREAAELLGQVEYERRQYADARREFALILDEYKAALGMLDGTPLGNAALSRAAAAAPLS